jgi:hypothetical protein
MLVALGRRENLTLDLAYRGAQTLADATLAVGFNLGASRWFEIFAQLSDLLSCER